MFFSEEKNQKTFACFALGGAGVLSWLGVASSFAAKIGRTRRGAEIPGLLVHCEEVARGAAKLLRNEARHPPQARPKREKVFWFFFFKKRTSFLTFALTTVHHRRDVENHNPLSPDRQQRKNVRDERLKANAEAVQRQGSAVDGPDGADGFDGDGGPRGFEQADGFGDGLRRVAGDVFDAVVELAGVVEHGGGGGLADGGDRWHPAIWPRLRNCTPPMAPGSAARLVGRPVKPGHWILWMRWPEASMILASDWRSMSMAMAQRVVSMLPWERKAPASRSIIGLSQAAESSVSKASWAKP